jgi:heat shock protein HspQ
MTQTRARFQVGQPIHHKRFDYRGVIVDVDPVFAGTEEWYEVMATSRPPKDRPWYLTGEPIRHPELGQFFGRFADGLYAPRHRPN